MTNEDTFLCSLNEDPCDEVAWLALADWFEENGQDERGQLVRLVSRLRGMRDWRQSEKRVDVEGRIAALLIAGVRPAVPLVSNAIGMRLALIPPGTFRMGSPRSEEKRTISESSHEVTLTQPFYLGIHAVTQEQYRRVTGNNPSWFSKGGLGKSDVADLDTRDFPVEQVSWLDARMFCQTLSDMLEEKSAGRAYRLPTEAEWEYACRAWTTAPWYFGEAISSRYANFNGSRPYGGGARGPDLHRPTPVGSYPPNALGLYDLLGNLWEYCSDWYSYNPDYTEALVSPPLHRSRGVDPQGPASGVQKSIRGASWLLSGWQCRSAYRLGVALDYRNYSVGFRVATTVTG